MLVKSTKSFAAIRSSGLMPSRRRTRPRPAYQDPSLLRPVACNPHRRGGSARRRSNLLRRVAGRRSGATSTAFERPWTLLNGYGSNPRSRKGEHFRVSGRSPHGCGTTTRVTAPSFTIQTSAESQPEPVVQLRLPNQPRGLNRSDLSAIAALGVVAVNPHHVPGATSPVASSAVGCVA